MVGVFLQLQYAFCMLTEIRDKKWDLLESSPQIASHVVVNTSSSNMEVVEIYSSYVLFYHAYLYK